MTTLKASVILMALGAFGANSPAQATPTWWDSAQFRSSGSGTLSSDTSTAGGSFWVDLDNVAQDGYKKTLYFVLDWHSAINNAPLIDVTAFSWTSFDPSPGSGYVPTGGKAPITVVRTDTSVDSIYYHHREYSLTLDTQPEHDYARLVWSFLPPDSKADYNWQFRSFCAPVPEPETYAMLLAGLGVLGVAARRKARGSAK